MKKGWAWVNVAYSPVTSGADQASVAVQPYGSSSGGVATSIGVGRKSERRLEKKGPPFAIIWITDQRTERRDRLTLTQADSNKVCEEAATSGEACPATILGITLHNRVVRKSAWTMVSGTSVCRDGLGNVGKRSTSACAPKNVKEDVLDTKNAGCRPSQGATVERDQKTSRQNTLVHPSEGDGGNRDAPTIASPPCTITSVATKSRTRLRGGRASSAATR